MATLTYFLVMLAIAAVFASAITLTMWGVFVILRSLFDRFPKASILASFAILVYLLATSRYELSAVFAIALSGEKVDLRSGCVIDGHWGQYGASRLLRECDDVLGTHLWEEARSELEKLRDGETAEDWERSMAEDCLESIGTDELGGCEIVLEFADEAEQLLNAATTGGFWEWSDGEFFLVETAEGECATCGSILVMLGGSPVCAEDESHNVRLGPIAEALEARYRLARTRYGLSASEAITYARNWREVAQGNLCDVHACKDCGDFS